MNPSVARHAQMLSATNCPHASPASIDRERSAPGPEEIAAIEASRRAVSAVTCAGAGYSLISIA